MFRSQMSSSVILSLLLSLSLGACSFKKNPDEPEAPTSQGDVLKRLEEQKKQEVFNGTLTEQNVKVEFEEGEYGLYTMKITWPHGPHTVTVFVNDRNSVVKAGSDSFQLSVVEGSVNTIKLNSHVGGQPLPSLELVKTAPKDFVVNNKFNLKRDLALDVNRFVLKANSQLFVNQYSFRVNAKKMIVEPSLEMDGAEIFRRSQILTNLPGVAEGNDEIHGSRISISAEKASGNLVISMIGVDGQDGRSGEKLESDKSISNLRDLSLDGANGKDAVLGKICIPIPTGGCQEELGCIEAPTNGENGKPGSVGMAGENGWNGGSTGSLMMKVDDDSEFSLQVYQRAGKPGKGGEGAPGHLGGAGGKAGKMGSGAYCYSDAKDGQPGVRGPQGPQGKDGNPGVVLKPEIFGVQRSQVIAL